MEHDALAHTLRDAALLRGTFTLRSGRTSSYYLDKYRFTTRPDLLAPIAELLARRIEELDRVDRLAGAELGGVPLVTAAGLVTALPFLLVRNQKKDYGTSKQVEGVSAPGDRVALIEDVATSGGQAVEAVKSLRAIDCEVVAVIAVIDRQEGARTTIEACGARFESLFTKSDLAVKE